MLTREEILRLSERPPTIEAVEVPEWGGTVHVRAMTCKEKDAFEASRIRRGKDGKDVPNLANLRGRFAALVLCDEKGNRLFGDDDAGMLGDLESCGMERVLAVAQRLNGLTEESVKEAEGNSEAAPSGGSSTD